MNTFSESLGYYMKLKDLSSYELSRVTGIEKGYISELKDGIKTNPGINIICRLCKGLEISPNELIPKCMWKKDGVIDSEGSIKNIKS